MNVHSAAITLSIILLLTYAVTSFLYLFIYFGGEGGGGGRLIDGVRIVVDDGGYDLQ